MSWFKSVFKAVGKAGKFVGKVVKKVAPTVLSSVASMIPVVGPVASSIVSKLVPDQPEEVQQQAQQIVAEAAAAPPVPEPMAIARAAEVKQALINVGVPAEQASSVGAVVKVSAEAPASASADVLHSINEKLPPAALQQGFTKSDIKTIASGALEGAKNGAVDAYLDETESGKQTKKDAVEAQGSKMMPFLALGLLAFIFFRKK